MQIKKVHITAFGPFVDQNLELAPGMNVIYGPNESGKTTWHAALYAGLCGMRRGRGQSREDKDFAALHRSWGGTTWRVAMTLKLADGREMELQHDLEGRVDCRASDMRGRDVSREIMNDGTPDGSVWLGLDRRAFLATACVGQAEILTVMSNPTQLQEHLQRAAATAGTDETAAAALELLVAYKGEHVGRIWANSTKPLQAATSALAKAEVAVESATAKHQQYLADAEQVEHLEVRSAQTGRELDIFDAAVTRRSAKDAKVRLERATALQTKYAGRDAPNFAADEELARDVAGGLARWEKLAAPPEMQGHTADELVEQLSQLPGAIPGDLAPDPAVLDARNAAVTARSVLAQHLDQQPAEPESVDTAVTDQELRDLAREIETYVPAVDPSLQARRREAQERLAQSVGKKVSLPMLVAAAVLMLVGGAGAILVHPLAGLVAVAGIVLAAFAVLRRSTGARLDALQAIVTLDAEGGVQLQSAEAAQVRKNAALARLGELELPKDPTALCALAERVSLAGHQRTLVDNWVQRKSWCEGLASQADRALADALIAHGVIATTGAVLAADEYIRECGERARAAELAGRRAGLEGQITAREHLEAVAKAAKEAKADALLALRQVTGRCGLAEGKPDVMVEQLRAWLTQRTAKRAEHQVEVQERTELDGILGGQSIEDLATSVRQNLERADRLETKLKAADISLLKIPGDWEDELRRLREVHEGASQEADEARGRLEVLTNQLPSVAAAEEALCAAQAELLRVQELQHTLDTTIQYLEEAQERVHNDIAPVLAGTLQEWLPKVTGARYLEARVDPENLLVQVRGKDAPWRDAQYLSQGTREQIYLLLRMAMVEHLTAKGECAPLILDDVTVQCDTTRTAALLDLLHTMSVGRQIVLFSQEDDVRAWARDHLGGAQDSLKLLTAESVPV